VAAWIVAGIGWWLAVNLFFVSLKLCYYRRRDGFVIGLLWNELEEYKNEDISLTRRRISAKILAEFGECQN